MAVIRQELLRPRAARRLPSAGVLKLLPFRPTWRCLRERADGNSWLRSPDGSFLWDDRERFRSTAEPHGRRFPAILHNAFASSDGSKVVILVNPTTALQTGELALEGKRIPVRLAPARKRC
jgi:hypothetical protein